MEDLDCYLFIAIDIPEEERTMSVLCVECHEKMQQGIFYRGSKEGYSNYDWQCCVCNKYIHKANNGGQNEETTQIETTC
jgi:hypothetical protein